jgi:hypothetical protein
MGCINLAQDRDQWRAPVNIVMSLGFHEMLESSWVAAQLAAAQEGLSSTKLLYLVTVYLVYLQMTKSNIHIYIVACTPIARQLLQHTRSQQYRNTVFFVRRQANAWGSDVTQQHWQRHVTSTFPHVTSHTPARSCIFLLSDWGFYRRNWIS